MSVTTRCRPWSEPGSIWFGEFGIIAIAQEEPCGTSWTTRKSPAR